MVSKVIAVFCGLVVSVFLPAVAQEASVPKQVHLVWMGGPDCPPCVAWRATDLPKLKETADFKAIEFTYVIKMIRSSVPSKFFLPEAVKPMKDMLDEASSGGAGSPQAALIVDGKVFDYFKGTRTADEIEKMLISVRTNTPYPFTRCVKVSAAWRGCKTTG